MFCNFYPFHDIITIYWNAKLLRTVCRKSAELSIIIYENDSVYDLGGEYIG